MFAATTPCGVPPPPNNTNGIMPVFSNNNNVYCINNFGWSDTWLVNNPTGPNYDSSVSANFDILSGDDAPWVQNVTGAGTTGSWLSPTLDQGTLSAKSVTNGGVDGNGWTVTSGLAYTPNASTVCGNTDCQAQSVIQDATGGNGLQVTITTTVRANNLTIDYFFQALGNASYTDLQMMDYFNAHPAGSTNAARQCGTTSYAAGQITTVNSCGGPIVSSAFMTGSQAPVQAETGVASATFGTPVVWQSVQTGALNNLTPIVGPTDSAGALLWDLGAVSGRNTADLTISKGFAINIGTPEPGTLAMGIGAALLLLGLRRKRSA